MFIGHFAVGFAAKSRARATPLTVLVMAALFLDVLWPLLLALGVEHAAIAPGDRPFLGFDFVSYPWSHSLVVLDFVTHVPDLPIAPGLPWKVGLALWTHPAATIVIEAVMFLGGLALYLRATRARSAWGHVSLLSLVALLGWAYYANVAGPPPPSVSAVVMVAMVANVVTVAWLVWIDRTHFPGPYGAGDAP